MKGTARFRSKRLCGRHVYLAAVVMLAGPLLAARAQTAAQGGPPTEPAPRLEVSAQVWDFGEKWAGEKAETTLILKNVGAAPLHIRRVQSSCGCTAARLSSKVLQPGRSEELGISYNTRKRGENVRQKILVFSDDRANPVTMIQVRGRVRQLLALDPPGGLRFGTLGRDEVVSKAVRIECTYAEPVRLRLKETRFDHFDVQLEEIEAGKRYELSITTRPPLPGGRLNASARLLTGLEIIPEFPVRISGSVRSPVAVMPHKLYVAGYAEKAAPRTLRVVSRRAEPLEIKRVSASVPAIKAEILPPMPRAPGAATGNTALIRVTLPPASEIPAQGAQITITTNDGEYPELVVPVLKRQIVARPRDIKATRQKPEAEPAQRSPLEKP